MSPPVTSLPSAAGTPPPQIDEDRVAMSKEALKHAFLDNLFYIQGKFPALATKTDYYMALAYAVRDRMLQRWISTAAAYTKQGSRTVAYLSAEFLMGPHLGNNLINLGIYDTARTAVAELGLDLEELLAHEDEPGLGQRRPRAPRGVFHRFAGHARSAGAGLRHPLRVRHLPAGDRRRLAGGENRQVAALRQSLGDRAARVVLRREVRRPHRSLVRRVRPQAYALGAGPHRQWHSLRHAHPRLSREHGEHAAAVESRGARVLRLRHLQSRRLLRRRQPEGGQRKPHQGSLPERRTGARQGAAARTAVLLRLVLAAGHAAHLQACRRFRRSASTRSSPSR